MAVTDAITACVGIICGSGVIVGLFYFMSKDL